MKIIMLGAPGAGKGTYAKRLKDRYNLSHISTGDLLREAISKETKEGLEAKKLISQGTLVPDEMIADLLKEKLKEIEGGIILDGFPRTIKQAEILNEITNIHSVLKFDVTDETVLRRLGGRLTCKKCGEIFHKTNIPPKKEGFCDKCEGELFIREDDTEETILNRLKTYKEQIAPLEDYYNNLEILKAIDSNLDISDPEIKTMDECQKILDEIQKNL